MSGHGAAAWADALLAIRLLIGNPRGIGGIRLRARASPVRDRWLAALDAAAGDRPVRRLPPAIASDRLTGGLDLEATLVHGRPVLQSGLLAATDGGLLVVPMAERLAPGIAATLAAALDEGLVRIEREGLSRTARARFALVLLDEGDGPDERPPAALLDRVGIDLSLDGLALADCADTAGALPDAGEDADAPVETLCAIADALAVPGLRAPLRALAVARASAGAAGHGTLTEGDLACAARLVLFPRATQLPPPSEEVSDDQPTPSPPEPRDGDSAGDAQGRLADRIVEAARTALPAELLAGLARAGAGRAAAQAGKGAAAPRLSRRRGRPAGVGPGRPGHGARLHIVETLRAAAPWQRLRGGGTGRVRITPADFRMRRFAERTETLFVFVVDASGSAAAARLAEAKGAIELLLAEAYVKRTHVALIAFRGEGAELILPPTRALARAKRVLADLPGGGGTPLATGIEAGLALAQAARGRGQAPFLILLTDGRANVGRGVGAGREAAPEEALAAARAVAAAGIEAVVIDTATRPRDEPRKLAVAMRARYAALPRVEAAAMRGIVAAIGA